MSILETLVLSFFVVLAIYTGVGLLRSIIQNSRQGIQFREQLLARVKSERMHEMLNTLGIDAEQYTHTRRVNEIEMHISRCRQCANTDQCDRELEHGLTRAVEQYCPNNSDLLATPAKGRAA